ncbi:MAG: CmpA/NrtA family ABC transporter substrate-binding protein [Candidatus Binatia bacterium]
MTDLVLGFIPLLDCASLAVAHEHGFAEAEGLRLTLVRESSWANVRDRLVVGHFDAAHLLGPMTVASTLGIGHVQVPLVAPFAFGLGGNAITVSTSLRSEMREHQAALSGGVDADSPGGEARMAGEALRRVVHFRARNDLPPLTFGMVYPFSCHNYELRYWLAASGIHPDHDVRLVVIPPPLLVDSMRAGHLDGFCVGEPWNSVAVEAGVGSIALATTAIWKLSPEKVLGCRADWASRRPGELAALLRCLYRASAWCADARNHDDLARLLADPRYVGAPTALLRQALAGEPVLTKGEAPVRIEDFHVPLAHAATFPWVSHALWFYSQMVRWGQTRWSAQQLELVRATYRPDLYRTALAPLDLDIPDVDTRVEGRAGGSVALPSSKGRMSFDNDGFFDGKLYDPLELRAYATGFEIASPC